MKHYYNVKSYARTPEIQELPSLIDIQLRSFQDFLFGGRLLELFDEINPIQSFNGNLSLYFPGNIPQAQEFGLEYWFEESKYDEDACLERDMSFAAPLYVRVALVNHDQGDEVILQDIFLGDFPLMTEKGTFIINGTERVVVSQLIRSPGVYFDLEEERATGRQLSNAKLIPDRGAWMEFETRKTDYITIKFNRKRTIPVTILLRALAAIDDGLGASKSPIKTGDDEEILALFADVDNDETHKYIESSFKNEPVWDVKKKQTIAEVALIEFYKRMRPGDPPTLDNARDYLESQLFDQRRYDLERVGRYKLNQRLGLAGVIDPSHRTISKADIVALVRHMIIINSGQRGRDDIDHLGNRRVKTVGELIGNKLRIGLRRMERVVKERMSIREAEQLTPVSLINIRPIVAAVREFFGSSQLSQFMEQTNPLSELTHKRTLSALGPGGLRRERAGFDVRDVHHSHYGRICPIETPEGPNIGLIGRLASYAQVNDLGFIETPYRKVVNALPVRLETVERVPVVARVFRSVEKSRKVTKSLLGSILAKDIEIVVASASTENPLEVLHSEVSAGDGMLAKLSGIRGEVNKGKLPERETVAGYESHLSLVQENVETYFESRKRAIEILNLRPEFEDFNAEELQTRLYDFQTRAKSYYDAFSEFLHSIAEQRSTEVEDEEVKERFNQLHHRTDNFSNAVNRAERDIERKITDVNSQLSDEDKAELNSPSTIRQVFKAETVVDTEILKLLQASEHKIVSVVVTVPNSDLLERELYTEVHAGNGRIIANKGTAIDDEILQQLGLTDVAEVTIVSEEVKFADNPNLIGRRLYDDIEDAKGKVAFEEGTVLDAKIIGSLKRRKIKEVPVAPFATHEIEYLSADNEDKFIIAQANALLDDHNQFVSNRVSARYMQGFLSVPPQRIDYMDIAPRQIVGISAALIPFLSHDAANRALMGSNMQRQAVPLLTPDVSVVSTGMEGQAAYDSGQVLVSEIEAEVISVQGHRVIVRTADGEEVTYQLRKYERSNQSTCIDQRPLVRKGDSIKPGDVIADSSSTFDGQLALGHDVLTCFLSWDGGNYEDALLISEEMLRNDKFTSIHIEKHEIEARDTKLGPEEITYDIPNVGEEALKDLDEHGVVRIGAEVGPNDILVGKITPKGEKELSPEEKLLRAIFGEQAREVKDSSLRLPHGDRGKVIDVKVFTREEHPDLPAGVEKMVRVSVAQRRKLTVGDKMAGRHGNKGVISKIVPIEDMPYVDGGTPVEIILNPLGVPSRMNIGQILELHLGWAADRMGFRAVTPVFDGVREHEIQAELGRAWMLDWAWKQITEQAWDNQKRLAEIAGIGLEDFDDDMHVICAYLLDRVGESGIYDNEAIILERDEIYVRRVAVAEVLRELGYDPDEIMVYDNSDLTADMRDERDLAALRVSLCLWIQQTSSEEIELSDSLSIRELFDIANRVMFETGQPLPHYGKQTLYDGRTGEPFDRHVAVGFVHMLKLAHLVEDKAHARSTGPYSLVTQQPLGGKAQFGGQRFGEMEVWALEAYGAAHILQEMLTVKSDDVQGRVKTYESIVKGEPIEEPGIPTSFRVLVKELQSLGLAVEAITGSGDVIRFGKDDEQSRRPQPATGLLGLGSRQR
ncbi:MAG: DNA-directed RNA polymerase subunit beta [Chloroflexi bacterium]|nr:DNA-directed RNA polymerase subunit beta [Chloroflexota bacterium]